MGLKEAISAYKLIRHDGGGGNELFSGQRILYFSNLVIIVEFADSGSAIHSIKPILTSFKWR
jgi:hypothetical protein